MQNICQLEMLLNNTHTKGFQDVSLISNSPLKKYSVIQKQVPLIMTKHDL